MIHETFPEPKKELRWISKVDLLAEILVYLILLLGCFTSGFTAHDSFRGIAFAGCALLGVWSCIGYALGRWDQESLFVAKRLVIAGFVVVCLSGFQLIPFPAKFVTSLVSPWLKTVESAAMMGIQSPDTLPLALAPARGLLSWFQLVASVGFFSGIALLASRRSVAIRLMLSFPIIGIFAMIASGLAAVFESPARLNGIAYNPNHHAAMMIMTIVITVALLLSWQRKKHGSIIGIFTGNSPAILILLIIFGMITSWALTLSRGAIFFGSVGLLGWAAYEWWLTRSESVFHFSKKSLIIAGFVLILGILIILPIYRASGIVGKLQERMDDQTSWVDLGRLEMSRATLEGLMEVPLTGLGPAGTQHAINRFERTDSTRKAIWSHNDYVQVVSELGIPFALVLLALVVWVLLGYRRYFRLITKSYRPAELFLLRASLVAFLIVMCHALVDFHLRIPMIGLMALLLLAFITTPGIVYHLAYGKQSHH